MILGCIYDKNHELSYNAMKNLVSMYSFIQAININDDNAIFQDTKKYDYIITLGGDGLMLKALHKLMYTNVKVYGINLGSVGFLLNEYNSENLIKLLESAICTKLYPLEMDVLDAKGDRYKALAINEVSIMRQTSQAAKLQISINDIIQLNNLVADGAILSTPAGSTAYNSAVNGPIVPLTAEVLLLTPISPFRPRRWRGAVLARDSKICFKNLFHEARPVNVVADYLEIPDAVVITVHERRDISLNLLFDNDKSFYDKVLREQFS